MRQRTPIEARFWAKVDRRGPDECWPWVGSIQPSGYGQFRYGGDAHRWAYTLTVGPIPERHDIDHTCHNADTTCPGGRGCLHRRCCNPRHLAPATRSENTKRGGSGKARGAQQRARTHCPQGHPYDEANTHVALSRGYVTRTCRTCARERARIYRKRKMSG